MDEPLLIVMGKNQDYGVLKEDRQDLQRIIKENTGLNRPKETFLEGLVVEYIPAAELHHFGGPMHIDVRCERGEFQPDAMMNLFGQVKGYAKRHGAPYALLYNLNLSILKEASADVQLLIKTIQLNSP